MNPWLPHVQSEISLKQSPEDVTCNWKAGTLIVSALPEQMGNSGDKLVQILSFPTNNLFTYYWLQLKISDDLL